MIYRYTSFDTNGRQQLHALIQQLLGKAAGTSWEVIYDKETQKLEWRFGIERPAPEPVPELPEV